MRASKINTLKCSKLELLPDLLPNFGLAFGGWPPSEMNGMAIDEFCRWYELAVETLRDCAEQQNAMLKALFGGG